MNLPRLFITLGIVLVVLGLLWPWLNKLGLGRLPGDIVIDRPGFRFHFPITTSILVSLILTLIFWLMRK